MKIDSAKIDIGKCPVCNTNHDLQIEVHDSCYTVCCNNCLMNGNGFVRGPYSMTAEEAIKEWNLMKRKN
jgi:hypothetical protein